MPGLGCAPSKPHLTWFEDMFCIFMYFNVCVYIIYNLRLSIIDGVFLSLRIRSSEVGNSTIKSCHC